MSTTLLIDGNSLTYRAFFALPTDMATASGQVTNAVFGFTSMLINLIRDHQPDELLVTFDLPEPTFRHQMVETYKANREASPDILRQQMGLVRQVVETLGIPIIEIPGFEADDVIATVATQIRDRDGDDDVIVVTGDRDSYQLVEDPHIRVLYNKRGVSDYAFYDEAGIVERTGVHPNLYVQYAALRGDPSDNLPGVPGVGEKTAAKLINAYGGIDGIYENVEAQTPKLRENLAANEAQVRSNLDMMVLRRDVPVEGGPRPLDRSAIDFDAVKALFDFLEFRVLYDRLLEALGQEPVGDDGPAGDTIAVVVEELDDAAAAVAALDALRSDVALVVIDASWVGTPGRSALRGIGLVRDPATGEVLWIPAEVMAEPTVVDAVQALVGGGGVPVAAHGAKEIMRGLDPYGVSVHTLTLDTMIAAYLLDPAEARYSLDDLLERYLHQRLPDAAAVPSGQLDFGSTGDDGVSPAIETASRALGAALLVEPLLAALDARGLRSLNDDMEVPLVRVLARMEIVGVGVDVDELRRLRDELVAECDRLRQELWNDAGEEFNVNSTPQLREILFERLGLTPQKKTKTGYSTDAATLEKMLGEHPIIEHLLRYREVEKLRSTYGEGLLGEVASDGRIHATFNQTVARTGRLSSDAPNLHNIPVRSETGRSFRRAFVPAPGFELLVADYNQIELRCIAHLAEDPGLIEAFDAGQDIHTATAARIFSVADRDVSIEQRSKAKMVSYGLAYGMEAYGLAQRLAVPVPEAQAILDAYFEAFPSVRHYMETTVAEARERGYTETLFGRRRQIPELSSSNFRIRQAGERQAMNAGIQGLAADIFKVALVRLGAAIDEGGYASRLILQVHDEVLVEVADGELDAMTEVVLEAMNGAYSLRVPLEVNLAHGPSWAAAKA